MSEHIEFLTSEESYKNYYAGNPKLEESVKGLIEQIEQKNNKIKELEECLKYSNKSVNILQEENTGYRYKLNMLKDDLKEKIAEERNFMRELEHKSMAFHYANGRETLAKDILKTLEE